MARRDESPATPVAAGRRPCPVCGKPASPRHRPFCSGRCADIDLGRWLKENYRVADEETVEDQDRDDPVG
jgi:uncharacterized protein